MYAAAPTIYSPTFPTTEEGPSKIPPAAIWSATELGRIEITGMVTSKLPILAPRWSRHVLLLPLALDVGFLVLRRVEHGFCLLRRHSGNRLGGPGLGLARGGGRDPAPAPQPGPRMTPEPK